MFIKKEKFAGSTPDPITGANKALQGFPDSLLRLYLGGNCYWVTGWGVEPTNLAIFDFSWEECPKSFQYQHTPTSSVRNRGGWDVLGFLCGIRYGSISTWMSEEVNKSYSLVYKPRANQLFWGGILSSLRLPLINWWMRGCSFVQCIWVVQVYMYVYIYIYNL